eukprot:XP_001709321.1 Hypothetical protein GL50803_21138 [Giardia lamblia ATCC 50803]
MAPSEKFKEPQICERSSSAETDASKGSVNIVFTSEVTPFMTS